MIFIWKFPCFFTLVMLGGSIKIPTLTKEKELELKIPIGVKDKQQFVFYGEGVKSVNSGKKRQFYRSSEYFVS